MSKKFSDFNSNPVLNPKITTYPYRTALNTLYVFIAEIYFLVVNQTRGIVLVAQLLLHASTAPVVLLLKKKKGGYTPALLTVFTTHTDSQKKKKKTWLPSLL